jgi:hypothetical protein
VFSPHLHFATRSLDRRLARRHPVAATDTGQPLTIRLAGDAEPALDRLAAMDGRVLPTGPRLVAELGGEPIAALALVDATAVADPMRPSAPFVELLRLRAQQLETAA